jgi:hypothetical protein
MQFSLQANGPPQLQKKVLDLPALAQYVTFRISDEALNLFFLRRVCVKRPKRGEACMAAIGRTYTNPDMAGGSA